MVTEAQKLGNQGEKALQYLCAGYSIVSTRTDEDRLGWDYFLEVPQVNTKEQPIDKTNDMLRCLVQVKATTKSKHQISVKATALKPLIDADLPAFIILFEFEGNNVRRLFIRHIDEAIIELTLRRMRHSLNKSEKKQRDLGYITIHYEITDEIQYTGESLAKKLWSYVQKDFINYIQSKNNFRKWVGYNEIPISFTVQSTRNPIIDLIEHDLGIIPKLEVPQFTIKDNRFDVEVDQPLAQFIQGKMQIMSHNPIVNDKAAFSFSIATEHSDLIIPAVLRGSLFNAYAPVHEQRFRLTGGWFDIIVCPFSGNNEEDLDLAISVGYSIGKITINEQINPENIYTVEVLRSLILASYSLGSTKTLRFTIWFDSTSGYSIASEISGLEGYPSMIREFKLINSLFDILTEGEIDVSTCSLSLNGLISQTEEIIFFDNVLKKQLIDSKINWQFDLKENLIDEKLLESKCAAWLSIGRIKFEKCDLIIVAGIILDEINVELVSGKFSAKITDTKLIEITPLIGHKLRIRNLETRCNTYLSEIKPCMVFKQFQTSIEDLLR